MRTAIRAAAVALVLAVPIAAHAQGTGQPWERDRMAADSARVRGDWSAYARHVEALYRALNAYPTTIVAQARASLHLGDTAAALRWLGAYADMGLSRDIEADTDFASLHRSYEWTRLVDRLKRNARPFSRAMTGFSVTQTDILAEDIAYDPGTRRFFVSSARYGKIVAVDTAGVATDFVPTGRDSPWSVLALAVDARRGILWATVASLQQRIHAVQGDTGKSAIIAYDLRTGAVRRRFQPHEPGAHSLGDMALGRDGSVYVSDAAAAAVYVIRPGARELEWLVPPGQLVSPQQPAVAPDGRVFVADYVRGIAVVESHDRAVRWLGNPKPVAINGIDGLVFIGPTTLLAVQNGTTPARVVRLSLDPTRANVVDAVPIEVEASDRVPTHGVIAGDEYFFIASSGWNAFDEDGPRKPGVPATGAIVRRVKLR